MIDRQRAFVDRLNSGGKRILWGGEDVLKIARRFGFKDGVGALSAAAFETRRQSRSSLTSRPRAADADTTATRYVFTISTASVDRYGDTIAVDGWQLDNYRANPVVLWQHDSDLLPLGRSPKVWATGKRLKAEVIFSPAGLARFNDTAEGLLKGGFLSATSVGFIPIRWEWVDEDGRGFGIDFLEQELLEFSIVNMPANPECLYEGAIAGDSKSQITDQARARAQALVEVATARAEGSR